MVVPTFKKVYVFKVYVPFSCPSLHSEDLSGIRNVKYPSRMFLAVALRRPAKPK